MHWIVVFLQLNLNVIDCSEIFVVDYQKENIFKYNFKPFELATKLNVKVNSICIYEDSYYWSDFFRMLVSQPLKHEKNETLNWVLQLTSTVIMTPDSVSCKIRVQCQKAFGWYLKKIINVAVIHIQMSAPNNTAMLCMFSTHNFCEPGKKIGMKYFFCISFRHCLRSVYNSDVVSLGIL